MGKSQEKQEEYKVLADEYNYAIGGEITVCITLAEYRALIQKAVLHEVEIEMLKERLGIAKQRTDKDILPPKSAEIELPTTQ